MLSSVTLLLGAVVLAHSLAVLFQLMHVLIER
jgi:hypothetical protein